MGSGFITRRVTTSTKVCFFTCRGVGMSAARECGRTLPPERAEEWGRFARGMPGDAACVVQ